MKILDLLNAPWAITEDKLAQMQSIYLAHLRGEVLSDAEIESRLAHAASGKVKAISGSSSSSSEDNGYTIIDGVAVLPIDGVISKRMNMYSRISGGTSSQLLQSDFSAAMNDPLVHSVLLLVDSPGGEVDGSQAAAELIRAARDSKQKPIVALADGLMASAAYWIGSAAESVMIASDTTVVGSIGVIGSHADYSKRNDALGIKVTDIAAGKYKAIASKNAPLSPEGRAFIQDQLDHAYSVFVNDVAANRGVSPDKVLNDMAEGRIFPGQKAISAGLADGKASLQSLVADLNARHKSLSRSRSTVLSGSLSPQTITTLKKGEPSSVSTTPLIFNSGGKAITITTQAELDAALKSHDEAAAAATQAAIQSAQATAKETATAEGRAAGAEAERNRIKAVEAQTLPGHEKLIAELKFDGKTTGDQAAAKVLEAERKALAGRAGDLRADAPGAAPSSTPDAAADTSAAARSGANANPEAQARELAPKIEAYMAEQKKAGKNVTYAQALAHVSKK